MEAIKFFISIFILSSVISYLASLLSEDLNAPWWNIIVTAAFPVSFGIVIIFYYPDYWKLGLFVLVVSIVAGSIIERYFLKKKNKEIELHEFEEQNLQDIDIIQKPIRRRTIPQKVKDQVWNRDGGKCVECGSNEKIEFDHIIPISKGGSNTYRNLQILCEKCNRSKSDKIG